MKPSSKSTLMIFMAAAAVVLCGAMWAQEKQDKPVDPKKPYLEIAGDYEFSFETQSMIVTFFEKDGKLFGAPPGQTPEEIVPVKDSPLKFEVFVTANGQLYQLEFVRNEKKVIDKCIMKGGGMELLGSKK